jgi:hypothetical protein
MNVSDIPTLSPHLLWEYNLESFDFDRSKKIVIERVIERGNISDWQVMLGLYGKADILAVSRKSKQLSKRDKQFTEIFVHSSFLHAATHQ